MLYQLSYGPLSGGALPELHAGWLTGIEPATSGATVRRSNRLSYSHHAGGCRSPAEPPKLITALAWSRPELRGQVRAVSSFGHRLPVQLHHRDNPPHRIRHEQRPAASCGPGQALAPQRSPAVPRSASAPPPAAPRAPAAGAATRSPPTRKGSRSRTPPPAPCREQQRIVRPCAAASSPAFSERLARRRLVRIAPGAPCAPSRAGRWSTIPAVARSPSCPPVPPRASRPGPAPRLAPPSSAETAHPASRQLSLKRRRCRYQSGATPFRMPDGFDQASG